MFECTTFPVALAVQHKVSLHLGDIQESRRWCSAKISLQLREKLISEAGKTSKICSQVPYRDALPWWSQCMVSSDTTNRTTKWDCQIGRWRFASASATSFCYLSISFTLVPGPPPEEKRTMRRSLVCLETKKDPSKSWWNSDAYWCILFKMHILSSAWRMKCHDSMCTGYLGSAKLLEDAFHGIHSFLPTPPNSLHP